MEYDELEKQVVLFYKWLHKNKMVPNSSFLWFDHTASHSKVEFFKLDELFWVFYNDGDIESYKKQRDDEVNKFLSEHQFKTTN